MRDVKRFVGSRFGDSQVQEEIKSWPFKNLKETVEAYLGKKVSMINNDRQQRMLVRARIPRTDTLLDEFTLGGIPPATAASIYNFSARKKAQKQDESWVESGTKDRGKYELWSRKTQKWKVRDVKCSKEIFQILAIKEHIGTINILYITESKRVRARIPRTDILLDEFSLGGIPPAPAASIYNALARRKAQKQDESRVESGTKD
ncbi:hypothetical protein Tco_0210047 [Tanacetum coccineum]